MAPDAQTPAPAAPQRLAQLVERLRDPSKNSVDVRRFGGWKGAAFFVRHYRLWAEQPGVEAVCLNMAAREVSKQGLQDLALLVVEVDGRVHVLDGQFTLAAVSYLAQRDERGNAVFLAALPTKLKAVWLKAPPETSAAEMVRACARP